MLRKLEKMPRSYMCLEEMWLGNLSSRHLSYVHIDSLPKAMHCKCVAAAFLAVLSAADIKRFCTAAKRQF